jgi:phytoene desaturase
MNRPKKTIVVGAGIGGLATAIRLAVKGHDVEVYEKNSVAGGKMYLIEKQGYRFDAGPSLFTQPANIEALFALAGENIRDYFSYVSVPIANRYFFENGKKVNAYTQAELFANEMSEQLGEPAEHILQYLRNSERVYDKVGSIFLNHSLHRSSTWLHPRILDAMKSVRLPYLFQTLDAFNRASFSTPEAVQLFNRFATYNGSNPYSAPGMLSLIPHLEQNQGTFYPQGGMVSIPNALVGLAKKLGVEFFLDTPVEEIVVKGQRATGIRVRGGITSADTVVSNVDAYYTYKRLLKDERGAKKILRNERSSSAFIFYWGINKVFSQLHLHNIFFTSDYQKEFDHLFRLKTYCDDPTVYINITAKMEAGHAPNGKENWFVMVNAPAVVDADWTVLAQQLRKNIVAKLSRMLGEDIEQCIEVEEILSPAGIQQQTDSYLGSLYGTSSNSKWAAFLRHANFSNRIDGLYFTGGSVHPGGGIPLCLQSAKIVSELIA